MILTRKIPSDLPSPANIDDGFRALISDGVSSTENYRRFHLAYNLPTFGWQAALALSESAHPFVPISKSRSLKWVFAAQTYLRHGEQVANNDKVKAVKAAYFLFTRPEELCNRQVLEAALMTNEGTPASLALTLGMDPDLIEAYEALFYNVYDRQEDHMYLRNMVYPWTRLEEYFEDQLTRGNLGRQLLRIGYNKGLEAVLFFSGFRTSVLHGLDENKASATFKKAIMIQGMMLAENGFLNYTKHHATILSAKAIVQSGLLGGVEQSSGYDMSTFASLARETLLGKAAAMRKEANAAAGLL